MLPAGYDNNVQIFQAPGYVVLAVEMVHDVRIVPLDGHPHLPPHIRQWLGDSRGHWEGNTLVVGTTNFTDKIGSFSTTRVSWGTGRRSWAGAVLRAARAAGPRAPVRATLLDEHHFDRFVEGLCDRFYAPVMGRPSLAPGRYFRLLLVGYFEGIDSERGIAWRATDSLAVRSFLRLAVDEAPPIIRRLRARGA